MRCGRQVREHCRRLRVLERRALRGMCGLERGKVTGQWRKLQN